MQVQAMFEKSNELQPFPEEQQSTLGAHVHEKDVSMTKTDDLGVCQLIA